MDRWNDLNRLAARQLGLVERTQVSGAGISVAALNRRAAREGWERPHRGVLALPGSVDSPQRRILAAVLATRNDSWATRWAAAYLWELVDRLRVPLTIVVPHGHRAAPLEQVAVLRSRTLVPADVTTRHGIPTVTPVRMIADLAAVVELPVLRGLAIDALQRKLLAVEQLWEIYERTWPVRGHRMLRRLVVELGGEKVDSAMEFRMRGALARAGLPPPHPEPFAVRDGNGKVIARVDIAWPEYRVGIECDGFRYHSEREQLDRDSARQNALVAEGWTLFRVMWRQLDEEPEVVIAQVRAFLREAGAI